MCDFERHVNFVIFKFDTGVYVFVHSLKLGVNVYIFIFLLCLCEFFIHCACIPEAYIYLCPKKTSAFMSIYYLNKRAILSSIYLDTFNRGIHKNRDKKQLV